MEIKWIKLSTDIFSNRKIRLISHMKDGDAIIVMWLHLLVLAGELNDGGAIYVTDGKPYTEEEFSVLMERPRELIALALRTFEAYGMIGYYDDKTMYIVNWDKYTKTPGDTVKLCIGGLIAVFFLFLKVIGQLKMPRRIVLFGIVFVMAYLLQAILDDLMLLSGMALAGEFLDFVCFQRAIRITKENILVGKTADATTAQVEEVLKKYIGRV